MSAADDVALDDGAHVRLLPPWTFTSVSGSSVVAIQHRPLHLARIRPHRLPLATALVLSNSLSNRAPVRHVNSSTTLARAHWCFALAQRCLSAMFRKSRLSFALSATLSLSFLIFLSFSITLK